jgi:hypothetical protein
MIAYRNSGKTEEALRVKETPENFNVLPKASSQTSSTTGEGTAKSKE